jgi:autotransporter translocation and assembly factor TamB
LGINLNVALLLGDAVQVNAIGLVTRITGGVNFTLSPTQQDPMPYAQGMISLRDGSFRSFGQDLDIETGQLIFANVPATEPELFLRAVRWIDNDPEVSAAGVLLTGPASAPQLELFSRPQLQTAEIQSYLLTGTATGRRRSTLGIGTYLNERIYVGYGYNLLEETSEFDALFSITPRYGLGLDAGEADSNFNLTFTVER